MGGSRGELAKDIAKVVAVRIHDPLLSSRVTKIPVKNKFQHGNERSGRGNSGVQGLARIYSERLHKNQY